MQVVTNLTLAYLFMSSTLLCFCHLRTSSELILRFSPSLLTSARVSSMLSLTTSLAAFSHYYPSTSSLVAVLRHYPSSIALDCGLPWPMLLSFPRVPRLYPSLLSFAATLISALQQCDSYKKYHPTGLIVIHPPPSHYFPLPFPQTCS